MAPGCFAHPESRAFWLVAGPRAGGHRVRSGDGVGEGVPQRAGHAWPAEKTTRGPQDFPAGHATVPRGFGAVSPPVFLEFHFQGV